MPMICKDCGCEDIRQDNVMGKYCNNCACSSFSYYKKDDVGVSVNYLKDVYLKQILNER